MATKSNAEPGAPGNDSTTSIVSVPVSELLAGLKVLIDESNNQREQYFDKLLSNAKQLIDDYRNPVPLPGTKPLEADQDTMSEADFEEFDRMQAINQTARCLLQGLVSGINPTHLLENIDGYVDAAYKLSIAFHAYK